MSHLSFGTLNVAGDVDASTKFNGFWIPSTYTGSGAEYQIASNFTEMNKWFWKVKQWQLTFSLDYEFNNRDDSDTADIRESGSVSFNEVRAGFEKSGGGEVVDERDLILPEPSSSYEFSILDTSGVYNGTVDWDNPLLDTEAYGGTFEVTLLYRSLVDVRRSNTNPSPLLDGYSTQTFMLIQVRDLGPSPGSPYSSYPLQARWLYQIQNESTDPTTTELAIDFDGQAHMPTLNRTDPVFGAPSVTATLDIEPYSFWSYT